MLYFEMGKVKDEGYVDESTIQTYRDIFCFGGVRENYSLVKQHTNVVNYENLPETPLYIGLAVCTTIIIIMNA